MQSAPSGVPTLSVGTSNVLNLFLMLLARDRDSGAARRRRIPLLVPQMSQGEDRMAPHHPGPRITHDIADASPHIGLIAMGRALRARRFLRLIGTMRQPPKNIVMQIFTGFTETSPVSMMIGAVDPEHRFDSLPLSLHALLFLRHLLCNHSLAR